MPDEFFYNSMHVKITYAQVRKAMRKERVALYKMSVTGRDAETIKKAVNQGIDSHLEACFCPDSGDKYKPVGRMIDGKLAVQSLECAVSPKSLPTLLRRLTEPEFKEEDQGTLIADAILSTLGFNELGKYVGSKLTVG